MNANKLMFKTAYGTHETIATPAGNKMENEYGYEINKKGQKVLVKTGETDLQAKIQAELEDTKIENIMAKAAQGDMSHFTANGIYADIADMPKTLVEAKQQIQKLENLWGEVPNEIKAKYDFDLEKFIGASNTNEWLEDMGIIGTQYVDIAEPATAPEVKSMGQIEETKEVKNES